MRYDKYSRRDLIAIIEAYQKLAKSALDWKEEFMNNGSWSYVCGAFENQLKHIANTDEVQEFVEFGRLLRDEE